MARGDRLQGRRALVTGAETGIGREIAFEFARQGADVFVHYALSAGNAEAVVEEIRRMGRRAAAFRADFDHIGEVLAVVPAAVKFLGGLDCLVNNSGITLAKPFEQVTPEEYDLLFHVNVRAQFFLTQAAAPHMLARKKGAVCNITSVHGLQGGQQHSVYAATKGAIIAQTRTMAIELASRGIRVNAIAPGWIIVERQFSAEAGIGERQLRRKAGALIPSARIGQPEDVARVAAFLCSDEAAFIVGQTVAVDGGTTALMSLFPPHGGAGPRPARSGQVGRKRK